jgi:hypothetical protein
VLVPLVCIRCQIANFLAPPWEYNDLKFKEAAMNNQTGTDRHYRVVRYYPDFGVGTNEDVLGYHLTMEEADKIAKENPPLVSDEEVTIEDENAIGPGETIRIDRK